MPPYIIDDSTHTTVTHPASHARGLVARDYSKHPVNSYGPNTAFDMPLIPRDQWVDRIKEMEATKSRLSDIRRTSGPGGGPMPSLDQNGVGYCWNHSGTMALMLARAVMNQPYVRLSAFFVGCLVKNYQDEGGWGAQGLDFIMKNGVPDVKFWPEKSMKRSNDTPECRANAALYKVTEGWADLSAAQYDRNLTEDQSMTCLLTRCPLIGDFNWWGHSVCLMDPTIISAQVAMTTALNSLDMNDPKDRAVMAAAFGKKGINSWTDQWGDLGEFDLQGSKAHLDGAVAVRVALAA